MDSSSSSSSSRSSSSITPLLTHACTPENAHLRRHFAQTYKHMCTCRHLSQGTPVPAFMHSPKRSGACTQKCARRAGTSVRMHASKRTRARTHESMHMRTHPCTGTSHKHASACACAGICVRERPCLHSRIHPSTAGRACRSAPAGLAQERACVHELACTCAYSHAAFCFLLPSPLLLLMPLVAAPVQLPRALLARGHATPKASRNSLGPRVRIFVRMFV